MPHKGLTRPYSATQGHIMPHKGNLRPIWLKKPIKGVQNFLNITVSHNVRTMPHNVHTMPHNVHTMPHKGLTRPDNATKGFTRA